MTNKEIREKVEDIITTYWNGNYTYERAVNKILQIVEESVKEERRKGWFSGAKAVAKVDDDELSSLKKV